MPICWTTFVNFPFKIHTGWTYVHILDRYKKQLNLHQRYAFALCKSAFHHDRIGDNLLWLLLLLHAFLLLPLLYEPIDVFVIKQMGRQKDVIWWWLLNHHKLKKKEIVEKMNWSVFIPIIFVIIITMKRNFYFGGTHLKHLERHRKEHIWSNLHHPVFPIKNRIDDKREVIQLYLAIRRRSFWTWL